MESVAEPSLLPLQVTEVVVMETVGPLSLFKVIKKVSLHEFASVISTVYKPAAKFVCVNCAAKELDQTSA